MRKHLLLVFYINFHTDISDFKYFLQNRHIGYKSSQHLFAGMDLFHLHFPGLVFAKSRTSTGRFSSSTLVSFGCLLISIDGQEIIHYWNCNSVLQTKFIVFLLSKSCLSTSQTAECVSLQFECLPLHTLTAVSECVSINPCEAQVSFQVAVYDFYHNWKVSLETIFCTSVSHALQLHLRYVFATDSGAHFTSVIFCLQFLTVCLQVHQLLCISNLQQSLCNELSLQVCMLPLWISICRKTQRYQRVPINAFWC